MGSKEVRVMASLMARSSLMGPQMLTRSRGCSRFASDHELYPECASAAAAHPCTATLIDRSDSTNSCSSQDGGGVGKDVVAGQWK